MIRLPTAIELREYKKFCPIRAKMFTPNWSKSLIDLVTSGIVPSSPSSLPPTPLSRKGINDSTEVPPLRYHGAAKAIALLSHFCINPKSLTFGYLDEKPIDTGLMKFLSLCLSTLSWYLEFAFAFSTSSAPLRPMLSLHESKGSMTPRKSHLCGTMMLPSP
ncbi:hypothetical protein GW17_00007714 [Ensete ventricosum]|nr:hypothetical protein GW17_00007714 [Ensete ventricosum]